MSYARMPRISTLTPLSLKPDLFGTLIDYGLRKSLTDCIVHPVISYSHRIEAR